VLNTPRQVQSWRQAAGGRLCDVMIDTGIGRLGLSPADVAAGVLDGLGIDTLMSHLACGDEDHAMNERQRALFVEVAAAVPARRLSLANSAGICLKGYAFDLTRPGLALYGGIPRPEAEGRIAQVLRAEAQIVQRRSIAIGESVGYNATFTAQQPTEIAILNIGYADGYLRGFSGGSGRVLHGGRSLPVCGRVSMDLTAIDVSAAPELLEGDWLELDYHLPSAAAASGLSQYELLTTLGRRHARIWR
jgi:alanine racemase